MISLTRLSRCLEACTTAHVLSSCIQSDRKHRIAHCISIDLMKQCLFARTYCKRLHLVRNRQCESNWTLISASMNADQQEMVREVVREVGEKRVVEYASASLCMHHDGDEESRSQSIR